MGDDIHWGVSKDAEGGVYATRSLLIFQCDNAKAKLWDKIR